MGKPGLLTFGKYDPPLRAEQVRLLYRGVGTSISAAMLIAGLLAFTQRQVVGQGIVLAWFGAFCVVSLARILAAVIYAREAPGPERAETWYALFVAGAVLAAIVWGTGAWLLFPPGDLVHQVFLGVVVSGVAAGGVMALAASLPAAGLFLVFTTAPITVRLLSSELDVMVNLGLMCVVFIILMIAGLLRFNRSILQNIQLKLQSEARQRDLDLARLEAEKASRIKSEFLSNMSHELRTPMNAVLGMSDVLIESGLNAEQREYTELIERSGRQLMTLIDDILDYARIDQGEMQLKFRSFTVNQVLDSIESHFAQRFQAKHLTLHLAVSGACPGILEGDVGRIRQVLMNLVDNAFKFTPQGEVRVQARCDPDDGGSVFLRFDVFDTGVGIPADARDRLFKAFSQADGSSTRRFGGAGLGLAIAQQLVDLMGGEIGFDSEPGHGAHFWFRLRLSQRASKVA